jgi:DNA-binding PadR family transcriptional regulator
MTHTKRSPEQLLPLTAVAFEILLTLADGDAHGYHIMHAVEERTAGAIVLHPGTLYRALARLMDEELIEEQPGTESADARRRQYSLTGFGRAVAEAETARLHRQLTHAKARRLLKRQS